MTFFRWGDDDDDDDDVACRDLERVKWEGGRFGVGLKGQRREGGRG